MTIEKGIKIILEDVFLEEIELNKVENKFDSQIDTKDMKDSKEIMEISGQLMHNTENKKLFKYILAVDFKLEDQFDISLVYDSYFKVETNDGNKEIDLNRELLTNGFNNYLWPYVTEQISNITSKMNIERKIIIPAYGVIADEQSGN